MEELGHSSKLPVLYQGSTRQEIAEVYSKVREFEINMMDVKSSLERRIAQLYEEIPSRLQRELKTLEDKDSQMWKN